MNIFHSRLRELRIEKNMSRAELAEKLHISIRMISYWEAGKRECTFDMLITLANVFDTTTDYLLGRSEY